MGKHVHHQPLVYLPMVRRYAPDRDLLSGYAAIHRLPVFKSRRPYYRLRPGRLVRHRPQKPGRGTADFKRRHGHRHLLLRRHADGKDGQSFRQTGGCPPIQRAGRPDQTSLQPDFLEPVHPQVRSRQPGGKRRRPLYGTDHSGKQAAGVR